MSECRYCGREEQECEAARMVRDLIKPRSGTQGIIPADWAKPEYSDELLEEFGEVIELAEEYLFKLHRKAHIVLMARSLQDELS